MKKRKIGLTMLVTLLLSSSVFAQSIEDGKKFFIYERFKSAKEVFSKLIAANAADLDAVYWLGITEVEMENVPAAKSLFQKSLMADPNSPLLIAAMGYVELIEGKNQDARQRFETAISLTKGKSIPVLNAIGYANVASKNGDADYAIDKLKQATSLKGMKDPDVYINLGDAFRKKWDGGAAQSAYENAITLNKNYARAYFKIGKIYQTQGPSQEEIFMKYYNETMQKDPAFAPVYFQLYTYYYKRDVNKSKIYLDKFIQYADDDPINCYYQASLLYASGDFVPSIKAADDCIVKNGENAYPNLFGLKAFAYDKLGDSLNAKKFFEQYFSKQVPEKLGPTDYSTYAKNLFKFPGNEQLASSYVDKAVELDTTEYGKITLLKTVAAGFETQKKFVEAADWYKKILSVKMNPNNIDIYNAGGNYAKGGDIKNSIDMFDLYIQKYPAESFGYYMNAKNYIKLDSTDASGKGLANYLKIVEMSDSLKGKPGETDRLKNSLRYLIEYYANVKKDKNSALLYCDKGIEIDPSDTEFATIKEQISKMSIKPTPAAPANKQAPGNKKPVQKKN